jgi:hypothetical protein
MRIAVIHASGFDYKKELYEPIKKSDLWRQHEILLPFEHSEFPVLKSLFKNHEIDLIIAEVSHASTGQGIELGWAEVYSIPVVCIYKKGFQYSGAVKIVSDKIIEYENEENMVRKIAGIVTGEPV